MYRYARKGTWVTLDAERVAWGWRVGRAFRADALARGVQDSQATEVGRLGRKVTDDEAISLHAFGVLGEWAAAVVLGRSDTWEPKMGVFLSESDLGFGIDARTAHVSSYGLWVRKREDPTHASVLVLLHELPDLRPKKGDVYRAGRALVVGWYRVGEALQRTEWLKDFKTGRKREICVPQEYLRPIEELRALVPERHPGESPLYDVEDDPALPPISFTDHLEPPDADPWEHPLPETQRARKQANTNALRALRERERLLQRAMEDAEKRAWIEEGNETRQPPEYRGRVWEAADRDGVHPIAFPPLREAAGGELSDEFIDFQSHNQTRYETHPQYYCVRCRMRYNARDGGMCGPCLGEIAQPADSTARAWKRSSGEPSQYPL